jgi:hypothetical protein
MDLPSRSKGGFVDNFYVGSQARRDIGFYVVLYAGTTGKFCYDVGHDLKSLPFSDSTPSLAHAGTIFNTFSLFRLFFCWLPTWLQKMAISLLTCSGNYSLESGIFLIRQNISSWERVSCNQAWPAWGINKLRPAKTAFALGTSHVLQEPSPQRPRSRKF